ncbi:hypothetical protein MtrunA17_Chr2g0319161 [Medicago truncatula]|uniref:Uncharacterized protein n=1 Tax=Medicago truncatula TaxID=3880 RepID=A0A396JFW1_MEDTR|nr:hypothetical protein MtrunA17_Chr2g0319161 [Medicago truncatula]
MTYSTVERAWNKFHYIVEQLQDKIQVIEIHFASILLFHFDK